MVGGEGEMKKETLGWVGIMMMMIRFFLICGGGGCEDFFVGVVVSVGGWVGSFLDFWINITIIIKNCDNINQEVLL